MTYNFTRTGPEIEAIHDTVSDPSTNQAFTDSIGEIVTPKYTDIVYKASDGNSAVENMIAGIPFSVAIGQTCRCENGTVFKKVSSSSSDIQDFEANGDIFASDFFMFDGSDGTNKLVDISLICDGFGVVFPKNASVEITATVNFKSPKYVDFGDLIVNYSRDNTTTPIQIGEDIVTEKHTLSSQLEPLTASLVLSDVSDISEGGMLSIYDPTDFSWSGWRADYRKGEYQFVSSISGNEVFFRGSTIDSYPAGSKVYLVKTNTVNLKGRLTVNNTGSYATSFGLRTYGLVSSDFTGLKVTLNNGTHAFAPTKSVNCYGTSMEAIQSSGQLSQREYGLIQINCSNNKFDGIFHAERHGSSVGSDGTPGGCINRDLEITGRITTTGLGGVHAADFHGDTENSKYGGYIEGVTSGGHNTTIIEGSTIFSAKADLAPLTYSELKSTRHSARNVTVISKGNPSDRGAIDAGGGSTVISANTTIGGAFDFSGAHIIAPDELTDLVTIKNNGATGIEYDIILDGITYEAPNANNFLSCVPDSGDDVHIVRFKGDAWKLGISATASEVDGLIQKGKTVITLDTSQNTMSESVLFDNPFPTARIPNVKHSLSLGVVGGKTLACEIASNSVTGFNIRLYNPDGTNFTASIAITVSWIAEAMPR